MVISKVSDSWTIKNKPTFPNIQSLNDNNQVTTTKNSSNSLNFSTTTSVCTSSTSTTTNTASTTNSWVQNYVKAQQSKKRKFGSGNYSQQQQQKGRTQTSNSSNSSRGAQFSNTIKSTSNQHLIQKASSSNSLNVQNQSKSVSGRSRKNSLKEVVDKLNIKAEHVVNVTTSSTVTNKIHGRQSPATGAPCRSSTPTQGQRCNSFTDFNSSSRTKGYNNSNIPGNKQPSNLSTKTSGRPLLTGSTNSKMSISGKTSARNSPILKASIPSTTARMQSVGGNSGNTSNKSTKVRPTVSRPISKSPTVINKPSNNCKPHSSVPPPNVSLYKKSADVSAFKIMGGSDNSLLNPRLNQRSKPQSSTQHQQQGKFRGGF